ncbi:MAG: 4Fe-4S dicluster domain-containing protein [Candidatus Methanogranum gryphiswaldense]|nr:MAG: 4Fe-4S dicluster domain-containing protein [Candidatus Methanogranum sp. U3.2.1]
MTMNHLIIDTDKCIGCKKCASACLKENIKIIDKKAVEQNTGCIECSHCVSVCPKGAIQLKNDDDDTKKSKWFDGRLISDEEFAFLFDAATHTAVRPEDRIDLISLKGERLNSFMELVWSIVKDKASTTPIVKEWEKWRKEHDLMEPNPVLWESQQVLFIFAKEQEDAMLASMKIQRKGFSMGISGFYSVIIMEAARESPEKIAEFFNEVPKQKKMQCAFVIGHGRRLIEPVFTPLNAIKKLFR